MSYSNFTLKTVQQHFQLQIIEELGIFATIPEIAISPYLATTLEENVFLAISINTEKARSELIIANLLVEIRKLFQRDISFFSGIDFTVDCELGLTGYCDFIVSRAKEQLFLTAPVIAIVEAKNENLMNGIGQCLAEMVAAQRFNIQEGQHIAKIYGTVTSGTAWKFLKLENNLVFLDLKDYSIDNAGKIVGILSAMVKQEA